MNSKLTPRERQILELLAYGNSQKEVAEMLKCSAYTIDVHVKHIKVKTGLGKVTELTAAWYFKKYRLPVIDLPERIRRLIAAAMLTLSIFAVVMHSSDLLRVFRVNNVRPMARRVGKPGTRRSRRKDDYYLKVA